jgi:hypothetical protein
MRCACFLGPYQHRRSLFGLNTIRERINKPLLVLVPNPAIHRFQPSPRSLQPLSSVVSLPVTRYQPARPSARYNRPSEPVENHLGARFVSTSPPNRATRLSNQPRSAMEDTYVRFEPNPLKIQAWRARLESPRAPQEDSTSPAELYARAVPTLLRWKDRLVESTLWREVRDHRAGLPPGILCVLEGVAPGSPAVEASYPSTSVSSNLSINSVWTGSVGSSSSSSGGGGAAASFLESVRSRSRSGGGNGNTTPVLDGSAAYHRGSPVSIAPPPPPSGALPPAPVPVPSVGGAVLALPAELSAFIEYRSQLEDIFQDPLLFYPYLDRKQELVLEAFDDATPTTHGHDQGHDTSAAASTLTDIFYLLQLLIPGMLLIVHDTLTFVNKYNNTPVPSERNGFTHHNGQSQSYHGRSTTLFEISLGNDTPSPSPKEFAPPTGTASRNGSSGSGGGGGTLSRVMLTRTRRGVPPAQWILNNALLLEEIFGRACLRAFHDCAEDRSRANWTTVYAAHGKRLELG